MEAELIKFVGDTMIHNPSSFRKPNTGMVEKAVNEFGISLSKSWIIKIKILI